MEVRPTSLHHPLHPTTPLYSLFFSLFSSNLFLVNVEVKARNVVVTGPLGSLKRSFKFITLDISKAADGKSLKVDIWFGNRESNASIRYLIIF
jgi:hypothetical protein